VLPPPEALRGGRGAGAPNAAAYATDLSTVRSLASRGLHAEGFSATVERVAVEDHAQDHLGVLGHLPGRVVPDEALLDQRVRLGLSSIGSVDRVAPREKASGDPAAHRAEPDDANRRHRASSAECLGAPAIGPRDTDLGWHFLTVSCLSSLTVH